MQQVVLQFGRISGTLCSTKAEVTSGEPALEEDSLEAITTPQTLKQSPVYEFRTILSNP
jgi:hypothetical protein